MNLKDIKTPVVNAVTLEFYETIDEFVQRNKNSCEDLCIQKCELEYVIPKDPFIENIMTFNEERFSEDGGVMSKVESVLEKHIYPILDELYEDMPKAYYPPRGEVIEVSRYDMWNYQGLKSPDEILNDDYYKDLMKSSFDIGEHNKELIKEAMKEFAVEVAKATLKNAADQLDPEKLVYKDPHDYSAGVTRVDNDDVDYVLDESNIPKL